MIYGLNFGAPEIPFKGLKQRIQRPIVQPDGKTVKQTRMMLVGVCETDEEKNLMTLQADNGHRKLYWTRKVYAHKEPLHLLYVY